MMILSVVLLLFVSTITSWSYHHISSRTVIPIRIISNALQPISFLNTNHRFYSKLSAARSQLSSDKIRVRLLKDVKEQGQKGEIVFVSAQIWFNVLLPKRFAERISDEDMLRIEEQTQMSAVQEVNKAEACAKAIQEKKSIKLTRKVGGSGQLFGSVSSKQIIDKLKEEFPSFNTVLSSKYIAVLKMVEYTHENDDIPSKLGDVITGEIRKAGKFKITFKIHPQIESSEIDLFVGA